MRIGMMIRTIDAIDGPGIYTINLLDNLLQIDKKNEYILFYKTKKHLGRYSSFENVKEILINVPNKLLWDQVAIPFVAWKEKIDIIFHTKFTVPFLTSKPTVMCLRGSEWFIYPEFYNKIDIMYIKLFMPLYCRKARKLISNSDTVKNDFIKFLGINGNKVTTIYNAHNTIFRVIHDETELSRARKKYNLPDRFVLTVTRSYHDGMKGFYPGKNIEKIIEGFQKSSISNSHHLVVVGEQIRDYLIKIGRADLSELTNVLFTGYVEQSDLPYFYNLASCFLFPSFYESFALPIIESMACGCPVITTRAGACPEEALDAAIYVDDPMNTASIAECLGKLVSYPALKKKLAKKGVNRARAFNYAETAKKTLAIIMSAANY